MGTMGGRRRHRWTWAGGPASVEWCTQPGCIVHRRPAARGRGTSPKYEYRSAGTLVWVTERPECKEEVKA